jgi:hypothetical protein
LTDDLRPRLMERARGGDWDAIEDLVSGATAPTFDAAFHLFGDASRAEKETEEALLEMLGRIGSGEIAGGDPLAATGRSLARACQSSSAAPFASGLSPEDLVILGLRPDDARRGAIARTPAADRIAAVLAMALDLEPADLARALEVSEKAAVAAVDRVLAAIPQAAPAEAFRSLLDARAAHVRVPLDVEERVLDRYEKR